MPHSSVFSAVIDTLVVRATAELFARHGVALALTGSRLPPPGEVQLAAMVGFTGESMRGTLLLAPMKELLRRSNPAVGGTARDWLEELTRELIERIGQALELRGAEVQATPPLVMKGQLLSPAQRGMSRPYCFASSVGGGVSVWFDCEVASGFALERGAGSPGEAAPLY